MTQSFRLLAVAVEGSLDWVFSSLQKKNKKEIIRGVA